MTELIREDDTLNQGRKKLNNAIKAFNETVVEGDSSVEAAQARVDEKGEVHPTLKARIDNGFTEVSSQLAQKANQSDIGDLTELNTEAKDNLVEAVNENVDYIEEAYDLSLFPQSPKPPKTGISTNSHKIVHKRSNNSLYITQPTNKGYVQYRLDVHNGASVEGRDYGQNHELLRLIRARHVPFAYVYARATNYILGNLEEFHAPGEYNTPEQRLIPDRFIDTSGNLTSHPNRPGIGTYRFASGSSVTFRIPSMAGKKYNVLFYCTSGSTDNINIYVNDGLIGNVKPRELVTSTGEASTYLFEFTLPSDVSSENIDLKIENSGASGWAYICALNFFELKDYDGQYITDYKTFGSTKQGWIENPGASDYAIRDSNGLIFGSYHGGEVSESCQVYFSSSGVFPGEYDYANIPFENINNGEWAVQKFLNIYQRTSLADGQARMISRFNFDNDGSMDMDFAYSSESNFPISSFRTALTSTNVEFRHVTYPLYHIFGTEPTGEYFEFPITEGRVSQVSSSQGLQLDIRFTRFNNRYANKGAYIADNAAYRKFYYGPLDGAHVLPLNSLTFSKGLDFLVR